MQTIQQQQKFKIQHERRSNSLQRDAGAQREEKHKEKTSAKMVKKYN